MHFSKIILDTFYFFFIGITFVHFPVSLLLKQIYPLCTFLIGLNMDDQKLYFVTDVSITFKDHFL